ncbi:MAG: hypothetical protein LKJ17_12095 [Oscillospiraceae bacterium]|nr:hypothetical protein [Oscillospiraceae bacterium]
MSTSNQTANYNLSQYAAGDPIKFLTNYNSDMAAIDAAVKAVKDSTDTKVPQSRTIADLPLTSDIALAQLLAAGLCPAPESGTWTPTLSGDTVAGAPTYTAQSGTWYKIGQKCHVDGNIEISSKGGMDGYLAIGGLPFSANAITAFAVASLYGISNISGAVQPIATGDTQISIGQSMSSTGGTWDVSADKITDTFLISISGDYITQ